MGVLYMLQYSITSHSIHSFLVTSTLLKFPNKYGMLQPCPKKRLLSYAGCFIISKFETYHQNYIFDDAKYKEIKQMNKLTSLMDFTKEDLMKILQSKNSMQELNKKIEQEQKEENEKLLKLLYDDDKIVYDSVLYFYTVKMKDIKSDTDKAIKIMTDFINQCHEYDDFINKTIKKMHDETVAKFKQDSPPEYKLRELKNKLSIFDEKLVNSIYKDEFDKLANDVDNATIIKNVSEILDLILNNDELKSLIPSNINPSDEKFELDINSAISIITNIKNKTNMLVLKNKKISDDLMTVSKKILTKEEYNTLELHNKQDINDDNSDYD